MDDNSISIVDVIQDAGIDLQQHGDLLKCCCPLHSGPDGRPEKTPSFTVYPKTNSFSCFGCGISGDVLSFVMAYYGDSYKDALDRLGLKDNIFNASRLRKKLDKAVQEENSFVPLWIFCNKLIYNKKLYMSAISVRLDNLLYLPTEEDKISEIQNIIKSLS